MPKKSDPSIIADAYMAFISQYDQYDTTETPNIQEPNHIVLHSQIPNPETVIQKRQSIEKLSIEAKEIINTILYSPEEILNHLQAKRITKRAVRLYFTSKWMSKWITEKTINELTKWANQL